MPPSARSVYDADHLADWAAVTSELTPPARVAVFGDPVAHSVSPVMQNAALTAAGIDAQYVRVRVRPEELGKALRAAAQARFIGINLTIPHKTAALGLLDAIDPAAGQIRAVNTVRVEQDGWLRGFNTDGPGFVRAVREAFGMELTGARVIILGAGGGAGRALATQCALEGAGKILLVNRTAAKAGELARELGSRCACEMVAWEEAAAALGGADLVVNASAVGLRAEDASPFPAQEIPAGMAVFDTVYRASGEATPLVAAAQAAGARAVGGLALLLHQGALSFEHWFGQPADLEAMRAALG